MNREEEQRSLRRYILRLVTLSIIVIQILIIVDLMMRPPETVYVPVTITEEVEVIKEVPVIFEEPERTDYTALTKEEFDMVCGMVMGEGDGQLMYKAIAQCMKDSMEINGWTAAETIQKLYGTPRTEWTPLVEECVRAVFFEGEKVTEEPIQYYYATDLCDSPWHETRPYVMTIKTTRFFA